MNENQQAVSAYGWSILVDIHAKLGDFEGCGHVIKEMAAEGVPPTQAAYTSLLAACHKVCNDGRIPHSIRAKAGEFGWRQWQEMIIVGIEPDVMAYGAIIRLCAARGLPERSISLLEDMQRFEVKPTTLCFSSALRAVARSHETAVRFERGWSRKQLRRETIAAHHGKMARSIVVMAENAEVEIDDGFTAALMLCAAAAGDSATAKAVYLAAEVRKLDHLRTIGPDSTLKQLRGEAPNLESPGMDGFDSEMISTSSPEQSGFLQSNGSTRSHLPQYRESFAEREYGRDSRPLSALLRSCAQAMSSNGIGTIWAGKQNKGYLCENSQRLITTRWEPRYTDTSVPGVSSTKLGITSLRGYDEDREERRKKGVRKKFRGLYVEDDDMKMTGTEFDEAFGTLVDDESDSNLDTDDPYKFLSGEAMASSLKDAKSTEETNDSNVDVNPKAEENGSWNGPNSPTKKGFKESNLLGADVDDGEGEEVMRGQIADEESFIEVRLEKNSYTAILFARCQIKINHCFRFLSYGQRTRAYLFALSFSGSMDGKIIMRWYILDRTVITFCFCVR